MVYDEEQMARAQAHKAAFWHARRMKQQGRWHNQPPEEEGVGSWGAVAGAAATWLVVAVACASPGYSQARGSQPPARSGRARG